MRWRERLETSFAVDLLAVTPFKYKLVSLAVTLWLLLSLAHTHIHTPVFGRGAHNGRKNHQRVFGRARREDARGGALVASLFSRVAKYCESFGVEVIILN
jgi:hypothetical protein